MQLVESEVDERATGKELGQPQSPIRTAQAEQDARTVTTNDSVQLEQRPPPLALLRRPSHRSPDPARPTAFVISATHTRTAAACFCRCTGTETESGCSPEEERKGSVWRAGTARTQGALSTRSLPRRFKVSGPVV